MVIYLIISWLLIGFLSGLYISIDINKEVYGFRHYKTDDIAFTLVFTLGGYISLIAAMIKLITNLLKSIFKSSIIWSEKKEE